MLKVAEGTESATRSFPLSLCDPFRFAVITDARHMGTRSKSEKSRQTNK